MESLKHYGVKGMHWGVRRYQNYDGTRIGAKRRESGGGFWDDAKKTGTKKSVVVRSVRKGTNDKPLGKKVDKKKAKKVIVESVRKGTNNKTLGQKAKELKEEKAVEYAENKMKSKDYSNKSSEEVMNDWFKYKKEYLGKKNGVEAYRKEVNYGKEPEGYSAKRQNHELKLRNDIKKAESFKEKAALKRELKDYSKESKKKANEYHEWLGRVRDYTGNYKQYELVKNGDKFANEWINKKTGQVITNKEYYDSFHYDATRRATDFIKLHYK